MKKKLITILAFVASVAGAEITYLDHTGAQQTLTASYIPVTSETATLADGWYAVTEDVTVSDRMTVSGSVYLILCDGAALTAEKGINVPDGASLTICAQSTGSSMGALTAGSTSAGSPAIGANPVGDITINGGRIEATGYYSSGIGGTSNRGGAITINGGDVTATGHGSSGYAGVNVGLGGFVMNGGTLHATGSKSGAGIGGGYMNTCGPITINGGVIYADSESTCGIGPYSSSNNVITINGGQITAKSIAATGAKAVLSVGWTDESDFVEARLNGKITWARHFALADSPTEYYNDTSAMSESKRLVPIEGHPALEHVEALAPTCTAEGCVEHWHCAVCGRNYADGDGETELDPVLAIIAHSPVYVEAAEPNGTTAGCTAHWVCENCGAFFADEACTEPLLRSEVLRIPYLDENGAYAVLEPGTYVMLGDYVADPAHHYSNAASFYDSGWYVVEEDYCEPYSYEIRSNLDVKIVLCDGATFSTPTDPAYIHVQLNTGAALSFYAQSTGADMGGFGVERNYIQLSNTSTLKVYGGRITVGSSASDYSFGGITCTSGDDCTASIHIYGGEVTALAKDNTISIGSYRGNTVEILGGKVNTGAAKISAGTIRLGWTDTEDRITAAACSGTVEFVNDFTYLEDGAHIHATAENLAGGALLPCSSCGESVYWRIDDGLLSIFGTGDMASYNTWDDVPAPWAGLNYSTAVIESGVTSVGEHAFYESGLTAVTIPEGVTLIGESAFEYCEGLTQVHVPASVTEIGENAFKYCSNLACLCSPVADGAAAEYCDENDIEFRLCGLSVTVYEAMGGTVAADKTDDLTEGDIVTLSATPTVTQDEVYVFTGWTVTDDYGRRVPVAGNAFTMPAASVTVTAQFTQIAGETGNVNWRFENGVLTIYGEGRTGSYGASRPAPWYGLSIRSAVIEDGVTYVGEYAFYSCDSLESVVIGSDVTGIEAYAFYSCDSLGSIDFGDSVATIGSHAFEYCTGLTEVSFPDSLQTIQQGGFCNSGLTEVTIPVGVETIENYAFSSCISLTRVHIPASVTSIGVQAFAYCYELQYICSPVADGPAAEYCDENGITFRLCGLTATLDEGVANGTIAADKTEDLTEGDTVTLTATPDANCGFFGWTVTDANGQTVEVAEDGSFTMPAVNVTVTARFLQIAGETGEVSWSFDNGVLTISGTGAMADYNRWDNIAPWHNLTVTSVVIGDGVTHIGNYAFSGCMALTNVTFPNSVTSIGDSSFISCKQLSALSIPEGLTSIEAAAFAMCESLEEVTIPESVELIGNTAFQSCTGLKTLTVENASIRDAAFMNCSALETVTLVAAASISWNAFDGCSSLENLTLGNGVNMIYGEAFKGCTSLESVTIPSSVTYLSTDVFINCSALKAATVEANIDEFYCQTFRNCGNLETLTIAGSVKVICGDSRFSFPSLKTLTIGGSVQAIESFAFDSCDSLQTVTIGGSVTSIGSRAFMSCMSLCSVTIEEGVESIVWRAFENCTALTSVHIPASVTSFGDEVFYGCTNLAYLCSPVADGPAAAWCAANGVTFYACELTVTLDQPTGGAIAADKTEDLLSGETVTLTATPDEGYSFNGWTVTRGDGQTVTVAADGTFTMPAGDVTVTAKFEPLTFAYPAYLDGADDLVKSNYVAWAAKYGADTESAYETAFLLNIDPAMSIPAGSSLLKVVDFSITDKVLHLELASDVCNLFQPAGLSGTTALCNGVFVLELADDLGAFATTQIRRQSNTTAISLPVTVNAAGHAVIDFDFDDLTLPSALFLRPVIGVKGIVKD